MNELRFDDRVAIVTGAGGGLGRSYAHLLAARGARVVVNDLGGSVDGQGADPAPARTVVDEIVSAGGTAVPNGDDVASAEGGRAIVDAALGSFGRLDILVNNAGILRDKTLHHLTPAMFDAVLDVHLRGTYFVTQPAYVHMRDAGYGRIVNTTSPAGLFGNFGQANYAAAKMGVIGLARTIAHEGAKHDVTANVIAPGALTRMTASLVGDAGAMMKPELVAPVVAWLAHESCQLRGEILCAVGGRVSRIFIGETSGYYDPRLTVESVAEHIDQIREKQGYTLPTNVYDSMRSLQELAANP